MGKTAPTSYLYFFVQGGLMWETPWIQFFQSCSEIPGDNEIQNMELTIRGMEIALTSCPFPLAWPNYVARSVIEQTKRFLGRANSSQYFSTRKISNITLANAQAQGITFGSVYGVLGCSVFQKIDNLRFLALLPWIIFSSFLKHSRIYGPTGGISALLGAVMILGRKNYGPLNEFAIIRLLAAVMILGRKNYGPLNEFAIIRLTETFIGLSCFIVVQFILYPKRAANLARNQLHCTLNILKECMNEIVQKDNQELQGLMEKQRKLQSNILDLKKFCLNAELEPDFWFLLFNATRYQKLQDSLSKVDDLFFFVVYNINNMSHDFQSGGVDCKELQEYINDELEIWKETVISSISTFLDKPSLIKLFPDDDLEEGKFGKKNDQKEERGLSFCFERSIEVIDRILSSQEKEELKGKSIISLYALGYCISSMLKEIKDIKMAMKELAQCER
ncbi:uncharacterized protein LOC129876963 [Solanum dulcamara]|uniref:uncharacterized protein LOC129876963 n=1 Tax=Solanum dulcamara TaxID=45834 RepID=UPI002486BE11|nr:uncharacterized protein LOC129876963 [Solanum dulcamara]